MASEYRPLTETELRELGYTTKVGSKYVHRDLAPTRENAQTRREISNITARSVGFSSYSEFQRIPNRRDWVGSNYRNFLVKAEKTHNMTEREMRRLSNPVSQEFHKAYMGALNSRGSKRNLDKLFDVLDIEIPDERKREWWDSNPRNMANYMGSKRGARRRARRNKLND